MSVPEAWGIALSAATLLSVIIAAAVTHGKLTRRVEEHGDKLDIHSGVLRDHGAKLEGHSERIARLEEWKSSRRVNVD